MSLLFFSFPAHGSLQTLNSSGLPLKHLQVLDLMSRTYPAHRPSENYIFLFQPRGLFCHDREMAAIGIWARDYYRDGVKFIMFWSEEIVPEIVA